MGADGGICYVDFISSKDEEEAKQLMKSLFFYDSNDYRNEDYNFIKKYSQPNRLIMPYSSLGDQIDFIFLCKNILPNLDSYQEVYKSISFQDLILDIQTEPDWIKQYNLIYSDAIKYTVSNRIFTIESYANSKYSILSLNILNYFANLKKLIKNFNSIQTWT